MSSVSMCCSSLQHPARGSLHPPNLETSCLFLEDFPLHLQRNDSSSSILQRQGELMEILKQPLP